ncbi:MAG: cytochrome c oxidase subunit 3 [Bacteroidetes bacterium]|mgnify:CR=1 FL=1|jgi:cytochrome c oxidase subunit 3|nr:cytochrome c oxidase subunit 3 [Bacteroidota bacterium]MBX7238357.1 cytochrome c oxidase subunit 3 [Bacteroidia bacterium]MCC7514144.1 cytochrome c oxidase subunit 3 [Bacteroidia bacterium]MCW5918363.1 cytochrome c oxidase subunit 3 [Bacteroidota bacterium]HCI58628.1 cytochrome oxidase subunit III [Bacteroidota bacterium]
MQTATTEQDNNYTGIPTAKILLWIAMASMVMLFAGLTSAYIVRKNEGNWIEFSLPKMFTISTIVIIISSFIIQYAVYAIKRNLLNQVKIAVITTLGLGIAFVFMQFYAWTVMVENGIHLVGNPSGSFIYVLSGMHILHLAGGIISMIVISVKSIQEKYSPKNYLGIQLGAIFWHFLDILWVYLFVFVTFIA